MYRPTSSTPLNLPFTNVTPSGTHADPSAISSDSESELSEVIDPPHADIEPALSIEHDNNMASQDEGSNGPGYSSEDALGSMDGEYDLEAPQPPSTRNAAFKYRSSSGASSTLGKRKSPVEEEDYMNENPELYGLRRSVCLSVHAYNV